MTRGSCNACIKMVARGYIQVFFLFLFYVSSSSSTSALSPAEKASIDRRELFTFKHKVDLFGGLRWKLKHKFVNRRLGRAYVALQAWKKAISADPFNATGNWIGPDVCSYNGIVCAPALDNPTEIVVAGIDLNNYDIDGRLPIEFGLLKDLALLHISSNKFRGKIPATFSRLHLLYELDLSNNHFDGKFPKVLVPLPSLKYLDIRFNNFEGSLPSALFTKDLDALLLNNNRFTSTIPDTLGSSPASVIVLANNKLTGEIPSSIGKMANTLNEIIFLNNSLSGNLPPELGSLGNLTVLNLASNSFSGPLPNFFKDLDNIKRIDISDNSFTGSVPESICQLPSLMNFTFSNNDFDGMEEACKSEKTKGIVFDDTGNCIPGTPKQKSSKTCQTVVTEPHHQSRPPPSRKTHAPCPPPPLNSQPRSPPNMMFSHQAGVEFSSTLNAHMFPGD